MPANLEFGVFELKELDATEKRKNFQYNDAQRQLYKEIGGYPGLDGDYTVYGEVVEGIEVADEIAALTKDGANRPNEDVKMAVRIVN